MHVHEEMSMDLVVIPIRDGSKNTEAVYSTHDGVTVINITKPEQAECFICSVSLNSLTRLEKHREEKHENEKLFYCDDCGIPKKTSKELRDHQRTNYQIDNCERVVCNLAGTDAYLSVSSWCLAVLWSFFDYEI